MFKPRSISESYRPDMLRRQIIASGTLAVAGVGIRGSAALADPNLEISHTEEGIHQERVLKASPRRVYAALTVESEFDRLIQLSGVMNDPAMATMREPTRLSPTVGGAFTLFGGYIVGRQIELVPGERIVQIWRVQGWPKGVYSIARFELLDQGGSTRLVFDHTAFPRGQAEHLASGWQEHYWEPLARYLA